jgi:hypothetical protein
MKRLYEMDIVECEGSLYASLDALVEYARKDPSAFVIFTDIELVDVEINDGLSITYKMVDEHDKDDNPIVVTKIDTFDYEWSSMLTLVA